MATQKKKHLIELMLESGVKWTDGAEYAAQDKRDLYVWFYSIKPKRTNYDSWDGGASGCIVDGLRLPSLCRNWHQTIVTREQYEKALADTSVTPTAQPSPEYCASVMRQMPDNTIEQLTADYHAKAAEADRLQSAADEALKAADDALLALGKAGELLGLVISIDTMQKLPMQSEITDWCDLRVGDVVEITSVHKRTLSDGYGEFIGTDAIVASVGAPELQDLVVVALNSTLHIDGFRFIRRP